MSTTYPHIKFDVVEVAPTARGVSVEAWYWPRPTDTVGITAGPTRVGFECELAAIRFGDTVYRDGTDHVAWGPDGGTAVARRLRLFATPRQLAALP